MLVKLQCVAEGSRLRMKIKTPGYFVDANCQCPRKIRVADKEYFVDSKYITLVQRAGAKYYYTVHKNAFTDLYNDKDYRESDVTADLKLPSKIYESEKCCICWDTSALKVFVPCGHVCTCDGCYKSLSTCPMCRAKIRLVVNITDLSI